MADLAQIHRTAQLRLGVATVAALSAAWKLLDPEDLDGTFNQWLAVITPIISGQRDASSRLAGAYLTALRSLHLGDTFPTVPAGPLNTGALTTSMLVTGPYSIRAALGRGIQLAQAAEVAQARTAAAGMRYALDGGREAIVETVKADPRANGWQRIASGNSCDFCSMLADRGAVYGEASADFQAHDGCSCSAEPVYA